MDIPASKVRRPACWVMALAAVMALSAIGCTRQARIDRYLASANRDFVAGDYPRAKIEYMNVLRLDPKREVALQRVGIIWREQGDPILALHFLLKARDVGPENTTTRANLASVFISLNDMRAARNEAQTLIERNPGSKEAILLLSEASTERSDIEAASQILQNFKDKTTAEFWLASAQIAFKKGDRPGATAQVDKALAADPASVESLLASAAVSFSQKDIPAAEAKLKSAAELSPFRGSARLGYAVYKMQSGKVAEAKDLLKEMTRRTPDYLPAWLLQGQIALEENKPDEALALVRTVLSQDITNLGASILQARIRMVKGETRRAIEDLERLQMTYPALPNVKYALAMAYLQSGDTSRATAAVTQAVKGHPNYAEAVLLLAELNLRAKKPELVVPAISALLNAQPKLARARFLLTEAYRAQGKYEEAAAVLRDEIKDDPDDPKLHLMLGTILREQGKPLAARVELEKAQELAPRDLLPTSQLVELDLQDKAFDTALQRVRTQLQAQPNSAVAQFLAAKIYAAKNEWLDAETALENALHADPTYLTAYDLMTYVLIRQKKLPEAIDQLQSRLTKSPSDTSCLMVLGTLYEMTGQYAKAEEAYERLLAVSPDFGPALNNLAFNYAEHEKDLEKALGLAKKARNLLPADPRVADTLGWILYRKGDYQSALPLLQESAASTPASAEIIYHLGMASYMMNDIKAARIALEEASRSSADFPGKAEIPARLSFLHQDPGTDRARSPEELEDMLRKRPDDVVVRIALAEVWEGRGEWAKAAATYEQVLAQNRSLVAAILKLSRLRAEYLQQPQEAFELARKARELAPSDPEVAATFGLMAYRNGNFPLAYSLLREAVIPIRMIRARGETLGARAASTLHDFAWAAYAEGELAEAGEAMQRVIDAAPDSALSEDARVFLRLAGSEEKEGTQAPQLAEIDSMLSQRPDYVPALVARAGLELQRGDVKAARATYLVVLERFPDFALAQKRLASCYMDDPQTLPPAYDLASKAHRRAPSDPEACEILAEISYRRKDYAYAAKLFQEADAKRPLSVLSLYSLGMALRAAGEQQKGREALQAALAAGLSDPQRSEAVRVIDSLKSK